MMVPTWQGHRGSLLASLLCFLDVLMHNSLSAIARKPTVLEVKLRHPIMLGRWINCVIGHTTSPFISLMSFFYTTPWFVFVMYFNNMPGFTM